MCVLTYYWHFGFYISVNSLVFWKCNDFFCFFFYIYPLFQLQFVFRVGHIFFQGRPGGTFSNTVGTSGNGLIYLLKPSRDKSPLAGPEMKEVNFSVKYKWDLSTQMFCSSHIFVFWFFWSLQLRDFLSVYFLSCPSCLAKCKQRLRDICIFGPLSPKVTKNQKLKMGWTKTLVLSNTLTLFQSGGRLCPSNSLVPNFLYMVRQAQQGRRSFLLSFGDSWDLSPLSFSLAL